MSTLQLTTERVAGTASAVTDTGTALAREIGTMQDLLGRIRSGWQSSEAAPRFAAAMENHLLEASQLKDALLSQGTALSDVAGRFAATESALAAAVPGAV